MQLHEDWRYIVRFAWSVRLMALSAILSGVAASLTIAQPYLGVNPLLIAGIVGVATTTVCLLGIFARVVKQQGLN